MSKRNIYKIMSWIAFGFGILGLVGFISGVHKNLSSFSTHPFYAMVGLVVTPLVTLVFFILWDWLGRKANKIADQSKANQNRSI